MLFKCPYCGTPYARGDLECHYCFASGGFPRVLMVSLYWVVGLAAVAAGGAWLLWRTGMIHIW